MALCDAYNVHETLELISMSGYKKAKQRIDHMLTKSFLAGVFLSFGGFFLLIVGGGSAPLAQNFGPSIHKTIQAAVFPIGITLVAITGLDLFTSNTMILIVSTLNRKTTWLNLLICWIISFVGNFLGCLFFQYIFVYYTDLLSYEPYRSFSIRLTEMKSSVEWYQLFLRGIGGNWLACLALWMTTSARDLHSKIVSIYLPVWFFVSVGYDHCIANMFTVQMGMILGANLSIGRYLWAILAPVALGNIIGGGFFVGFINWYLYLAKPIDTNNAPSNPQQSYQIVKQQEDVVHS